MDSLFHPHGLFSDQSGHLVANRGRYGSPERNFQPLFRLLDDFDRYVAGSSSARTMPTFQPKFDVRESDAAFELHGELAGVERDNIHIEFTDSSTIMIRGRVERSYSAGTPIDTPVTGAITEAGEEKIEKEGSAEKDKKTETDKSGHTDPALKATVQDEATSKKAAKYWLTERSIGEFTRTFTFPAPVEPSGVTANLKDGVLTVVIPKSKKHEACRIHVA
jgi:HSP20 family molecular chaperone IbpA